MSEINLESQEQIELAEITAEEEELEQEVSESEVAVLALYRALASGDGDCVRRLVTPDLDWWFHGPRSEQHLMRMLTGADRLGSFSFAPLLLCTIDDKVFVEGHDTSSKVCWVHVWTVVGGVVTELREYFNTSVTVTGIDSSTFTKKTSQKAPKIADSEEFSTLWESELSRRSIPGFILAI